MLQKKKKKMMALLIVNLLEHKSALEGMCIICHVNQLRIGQWGVRKGETGGSIKATGPPRGSLRYQRT